MPRTFTFQTRIGQSDALDAYAELYGRVQRALFADLCRAHRAGQLKKAYLRRFDIPARLFNAARIDVEGKILSAKEGQANRIEHLKRKIKRAEKVLAKAERDGKADQAHQKRRRLGILRERLAWVEADRAAGRVRIAFGGKKLWRAQYNLAANGYESHAHWKRDWQQTRSGALYLVGSEDETAGCQLCVATVEEDGIALRLRMPDALAPTFGKYVTLRGLDFAYGEDAILAALANNAQYAAIRRRVGDQLARASGYGQAITYRFKRDKKGWRVFVSTEVQRTEVVTDRARGAIGIDVNADHLACTETDRFGNPVRSWSVPVVTYGKTMAQATALIGDAAAAIVDAAYAAGKPLVIERLDFRQKKDQLEQRGRRYARMLSALHYTKIKTMLRARAYRRGVVIHQVNPAYSSVIGRTKYAKRYGLSVHQAAALVLAQRILGVSERLPRHRVAPDGKGGHVTFGVPARTRVKHVWSHWAGVSRTLKAALAAQHRPAKADHPSTPVGRGISSVLPGAIPGREPPPALLGWRLHRFGEQ